MGRNGGALARCWPLLAVLMAAAHVVAQEERPLRIATIGDFGMNNEAERRVANMINAWDVDQVFALGDNNYQTGSADTIDANVGQFFARYISPYRGNFGPGATTNRFWPAIGNHDAGNTRCSADFFNGCPAQACTDPGWSIQPHWEYFETVDRYYSQRLGNGLVEVFVISSDCTEESGTSADSEQGRRIQGWMQASTATWKFVLLHHSPYSSSSAHGSITRMQWPFEQWGAHAVFSGHDHVYERIFREVDGASTVYFVNGLGGAPRNGFAQTPVPGSVRRYSDNHGAQLLEVTPTQVIARFYAATNPNNALASPIDCHSITRLDNGNIEHSNCDAPQRAYSLLTGAEAANNGNAGLPWSFTSENLNSANAWQLSSDNWPVGQARFGYGPLIGGNLPWNTALPNGNAATSHFFRTTFCLSAARRAWLRDQAATLRTACDNGCDVYINDVSVLRDAANDHNAVYWNNVVNVQDSAFREGVNTITAYLSNTRGSSDAAFDLDLTADASFTEPPAQITRGSFPTITQTSLTFSWDKPCDGSSFITRYEFTFTPPVPNQPNPINFNIGNPFIITNTMTVNSLQPCTRYTMSVVAVNAAGTSPAASAPITTLCQPTTQRTFSLLTGGNVSSTARTRPAIFWRYTSTSAPLKGGWMEPTYAPGSWRVGRARFGYGTTLGPGLRWTTALPNASTGRLRHYFKTHFCISAARKALFDAMNVTVLVLADNGADVFLNGRRILADSNADHDPTYWNNVVRIPGRTFVQGRNMIAAFVSNTAGSTDAGFDLDISYQAAQPLLELPESVPTATSGEITDTSISFNWPRPGCEGSSSVTLYEIRLTAPEGATPVDEQELRVPNPYQQLFSITIDNLEPCTRYGISIVAVNSFGAGPALTGALTTIGCQDGGANARAAAANAAAFGA